VLDGFCRRNLLPWIEIRSCAGTLGMAWRTLWNAHSWAKVSSFCTSGSLC
jgi:hypothetical protein